MLQITCDAGDARQKHGLSGQRKRQRRTDRPGQCRSGRDGAQGQEGHAARGDFKCCLGCRCRDCCRQAGDCGRSQSPRRGFRRYDGHWRSWGDRDPACYRQDGTGRHNARIPPTAGDRVCPGAPFRSAARATSGPIRQPVPGSRSLRSCSSDHGSPPCRDRDSCRGRPRETRLPRRRTPELQECCSWIVSDTLGISLPIARGGGPVRN